MFNRSLQMKMVKDPVDAKEDALYRYALVGSITDKIVKKVAIAALSYVIIDIIGQVAVARAVRH